MATGEGPGSDHLTHYRRLIETPTSHHIFLALRVLEAQHSDAPRLGTSRRPSQDRVRLRQEPSMAFAPATIAAFRPEGAGPASLSTWFFGLFGPHGPLPSHLTEYARERKTKHGDRTFVAFADMLTHRMMSLFYRAWVTGAPAVDLDRGEGTHFESHVAALAGHHGAALRNRDDMPDMAKRYFAGLLSSGVRNAEGLVALLRSFFDFPVRCQQFVGTWLHLEPEDRWRLGQGGMLGQDTNIGSAVWTRTSKFRLLVGPLGIDQYQRLLPGQPSLARLAAVVRNYVGDTLDYDVNIILRADEVPAATLGGTTRLGQTSWLGQRQAKTDAADLFLDVPSFTRNAA